MSEITKKPSIRDFIITNLRYLDDKIYSKKKQTNILFVYVDNYGFSCQAPIILELEKKDKISIGITTDINIKKNKIKCTNPHEQEIFNRYFISHHKAIFFKWHLILDTHLNGFYPKRHALRIGMHHGPGFGILGSKIHLVQNYDIFLGLSQFERYCLEQIKSDVFSGKRVFFAAGFPKADALVNCTINRTEIFDRLDLPVKPTILITSHWQPTSTLGTFGSAIFSTLASHFPNHNVIQTGHPWLWKGNKKIPNVDPLALKISLEDTARDYPNAFFLPNENAENLLQIADLLIADHSSIITSYCLLDNPIVWFDNPQVEFAIKEIREAYKNASHAFTDAESLIETCRNALTNPNTKQQGRQKMKDIFYTHPGNSAKNIAQLLVQIGPTCSTNSPNWPNIVKMSQQSYHSPNPNTRNYKMYD